MRQLTVVRGGALGRWPALAAFLGEEILAIADAMASGDWYREDAQQRADSMPGRDHVGYE